MADIVKNPVSSAIYLEKKDAALLERLKKIHPVKDLFTGNHLERYVEGPRLQKADRRHRVARAGLLYADDASGRIG